MSSILTSATQTAHSVAATLLSKSQVQPGNAISFKDVKEEAPDQAAALELKGRNIIVGVPGAFAGVCNAQVPGYINNVQKFKEKGIAEIFVVSVNDAFVMQAWKEHLANGNTSIRFVADDQGSFTGSVGMLFDASDLLGGPRSKRYVIVTNGDKVEKVAVEEDPGQVTCTAAEKILAQL
ncbi:hypothetical protein AMATHDRAFT_69595 [Amanita thiersii Skay4041]|uniref:Thioredoxin domain-containing protein n=1 Tax=Amanita thiersii Skay4041 TaxID=703135 RepID=A0A2A9NFJ2_9AGAR|nr:hypothetical protein AMATHDRAFT_69595 [Amanita thiersii Skay4041]